jgi:archaeal type IV pilus assembly protein PilA
MLMLVVTIIIAAVVSAFAGSISSGQKSAPMISAKCIIENTGDSSSRFDIRIDSVSDPIPSKDIKIVTSWSKVNLTDGTIIRGGNTTESGKSYITNYNSGGVAQYRIYPYGYGSGVTDWGAYGNPTPEQQFGNYTLTGGTSMHSVVYSPRSTGATTGGYVNWNYTYGSQFTTACTDGLQGTLGYHWEVLRDGDTVNVKLIHIPSGKTIYDKDVIVHGRD